MLFSSVSKLGAGSWDHWSRGGLQFSGGKGESNASLTSFGGTSQGAILIVDDDASVRRALHTTLRTLGFSTAEASSGEEALLLARANRYDVVLLDFNMPGRDGLALAADLRALNPTLPMALISANSQDEIVARTRALGAEFLPKPLTEAILAPFLTTLEPLPPAA